MNAFGILLRQRIRRDRVQVPIWILSTGLLALFSAASVAKTYSDAQGREALVRLAAGNPAVLMLRGVPQGASLDSLLFFEVYTYLALLAAFMSTFLAVRHSRADEESGRAELIAATPAARTTPTVATLVYGILANLVLGVFTTLCLIAGGLQSTGSLVTGAALAATGIAFLTIGLLAAQLMRTSRGANTLAVAAVGVAWLLRAVGDAAGTASADGLHVASAWPSWISPIGWGQQTAAYDANNPLPLLLSVALAVVCGIAVFLLQSSRDSGASLIPGRAGRVDARPNLSGSFGLAWRLQWPTILGWCAGSAVFGLLVGSLDGLLSSAVGSDASVTSALKSIVSGGGTLTEVFIAAIFGFIGALAAACAIQTVIRMRQEEALGTAEVVLATPLSRIRWLADYLVLGVVAVLLVLLAGAATAALSLLGSSGAGRNIGYVFEASAAQIPTALIFLAILAVVFIVLPSWTIGLGWTLFGAAVFLGLFGGLVGLPDWAKNLSPFAHTPVAGPSPQWDGALWMLLITIVLAAVALAGMRRREVRT